MSRVLVGIILASAVLLPLTALPIVLVQDATAVSQTSFTVDSSLDAVDANPGDGACATATNTCTLRAAIQETNALPGPDTIILPAGTYDLTITGPYDDDQAIWGDFDIRDDLTITGSGAADTRINGGGLDRIFEVPQGGSQVQVSSVTIENGYANYPNTNITEGAGIHVESGNVVTITSAVFVGNLAGRGGALSVVSGFYEQTSLNVVDTVVSDNEALEFGGGVYVHQAFASLVGVTITNNSSALDGGGIGTWTAVMVIEDSEISGNAAGSFGGGIKASAGVDLASITLVNSAVRNNEAVSGGGIDFSGPMTIIGSEISDNAASWWVGGIIGTGPLTMSNSLVGNNSAAAVGGGIMMNTDSAIAVIADSLIVENTSGEYGAGILSYGPIEITNAAVIGNVAATLGGGVYLDNNATLSNVTISQNQAGEAGGGIYQTTNSGYGEVYLHNVTIAENEALSAAGGLYHNDRGHVYVLNSIVANNSNGNCHGNIISEGHNLESGGSCPFTQSTDLRNVEPGLGPLGDNGGETLTHALLPFSPAVEAGTNVDCPSDDQRGVVRPIDADGDGTATCDIGAYEYDGSNAWLTIDSVRITEIEPGQVTTGTFTVELWYPLTDTVTVNYETVPGTATPGVDYEPTSGALSFAPGEVVQYIDVTVYSNPPVEFSETFFVILHTPVNAELFVSQGTGTILDGYWIRLPLVIKP